MDRRQEKRVDLALEDVSGDGRFSGYASLFGTMDLGRDIIEPGAFARSLASRGPGEVRMLYQHDPEQPIGRWTTIREDTRGLHVEGRLALGVTRAREVHELMKSGALDGLSIGFQTVKSRADRKTGARRILAADLWEISVVTFPMQPGARVTQVKQASARRDPQAGPQSAIRRATRSIAPLAGSRSGADRILIAMRMLRDAGRRAPRTRSCSASAFD
ncbi:HK97 family phage prohead protease [Hoeflea marina]